MVKSRHRSHAEARSVPRPFSAFQKWNIGEEIEKKMLFKEEGDKIETSRKRQIPYDKPGEIPAILRFPKVRNRQLAVK